MLLLPLVPSLLKRVQLAAAVERVVFSRVAKVIGFGGVAVGGDRALEYTIGASC